MLAGDLVLCRCYPSYHEGHLTWVLDLYYPSYNMHVEENILLCEQL